LAWVAGYVMRQFTCPKAVTHPSTNRARCRATALIETNALTLHQTANHTCEEEEWDQCEREQFGYWYEENEAHRYWFNIGVIFSQYQMS